MTVDVKRFLYGNDIDKLDKEGNQILNPRRLLINVQTVFVVTTRKKSGYEITGLFHQMLNSLAFMMHYSMDSFCTLVDLQFCVGDRFPFRMQVSCKVTSRLPFFLPVNHIFFLV